MNLIDILEKEFNINKKYIENTIKLIDEGNTIPFIARYRKEVTGGLEDEALRNLSEKLIYLRNLKDKKEDVLRLIEEQGKLDSDIKSKIDLANTIQEVDDVYRPFRPKRRTRATIAKEKGLEQLALDIYSQNINIKNKDEYLSKYINKELELESTEDVLEGVKDIIAEIISDNPTHRKKIRGIIFSKGQLEVKAKIKEESVYNMYYDYSESIKSIASHRILAINRGEKEKILKIKLVVDEDFILNYLYQSEISNEEFCFLDDIKESILDAYKRLVFPSIEREIRSELTTQAEKKAIDVFGKNLKSLLLQPPINNKVVMGFDPAYRTGCKIAIVDEIGKLLDYTTIYPTAPENKVLESKKILKRLIEKYNVDIISIGNGTASRESEEIISGLLSEIKRDIYYIITNEAGASVYSASKIAIEEYPDINVSIRGAISIAKRVQDPLSELVKIDPKHIGVGQYQHDVNQKELNESLKGVVEDVVNSVGVDLNTASISLLSYIAGISKSVAKNIIEYRKENGRFYDRKELKKVKRLGEKVFKQCAGFLKIYDGNNILDETSVHPESYNETEKLLNIIGCDKSELKKGFKDIDSLIKDKGKNYVLGELDLGEPTLNDIISELKKPRRDPRDEIEKPVLKSGIMKIEDLKEDMILTGTIRNVIDFGAFIDIGLKNDGLIHISELSNKFIKNPMEVVKIGDIVKVKVLEIDLNRNRVSLTMKDI